MINLKNVHTVPWQGKWANKHPYENDARDIFRRKKDAVRAGRTAAKSARAEHFIHSRNGRILVRNSYGRDPRGARG